jgi:soluble lytic murein transglycosylase-like protein
LPTLRYNPAPSVDPTLAPSEGFENIQASPNAFGANRGAELSQFGAQLGAASNQLFSGASARQEFLNQVAADDAYNQVQDFSNKLLYGDPNTPGDVGFYGAKGKDAMNLFPQARQKLDDFVGQARKGMQNPQQQHLFENTSRRFRSILFAEMGRHYDRELDNYALNTAKAGEKLGEFNMSAAAASGNDSAFEDALAQTMTRAAAAEEIQGHGPEAVDLAKRQAGAKAVRIQADAIGLKDPVAALDFLERHKDMVAPGEYPAVVKEFQGKAVQYQAMVDNGLAPPMQHRGPNLVRGGAVSVPPQYQGWVTDAAKQFGVPEDLLTRTLHAESGFDPNAVSPTGARGIAQFIQSTANERGVNRNDERSSIYGAASYLADLRQKTGSWEGALKDSLGSDPRIDPSYNKSGAIQSAIALDQGRSATQTAAPGNVEVWGDSLGVGLQRALKVPGGQAQGGLPPSEILANIKAQPEDYWRGKTVVLSSGSNQNQMPVVDETISYLKDKGANVVAVGYGPKFPEKNAQLQEIAQRQGVQVVAAEGVGASEGVHPSPQGYASMAQKISSLPKQDTLVPPPRDEGELPDETFPGLTDKIQGFMKKYADNPLQAMASVKLARQQANQSYADAQHQIRMKQQVQKAQDEQTEQGLMGRMTTNSANYPTTDEVNKLVGQGKMTAEAGRTMVGFIERQTKPDPLAHISARNQQDLYARIHADDSDPNKIYDKKPIRDSYIAGNLTWTARGELEADFDKLQGSREKDLAKAESDLLKVVEPKMWPELAMFGREKAGLYAGKPVPGQKTGPERVLDWKNAVTKKIDDYQKAGKNPRDLFNPANKADYVGGEDFLKPYLGTLNMQLGDKTAAFDLNTADLPSLQRAVAAGTITRDAAIAEAIKRGLVRPSIQPLAPPAR